jgi:hypothetical protein
MKTTMTLALGLMTLVAAAQPFNNTYDINAGTNRLTPAFVITNNASEAISVSNGTDGTSNYYVLTKIDASGSPIYNNIVRGNNDPTDGFLHVEALHEMDSGKVLVGGYYYRDRNTLIEWPFLSCFDNNGNCLWTRYYPVNQKPVLRSEINKASLCRVYDDNKETYFFVLSGDSDKNPGKEVATNVLKVDNVGTLIFSHKYYNTIPDSLLRDIREYPGDIEFSVRDKKYMITGYRQHYRINPTGSSTTGVTEYLMYYFAIDRNGLVYNNNYLTLAYKSIPLDQDMIYDPVKDHFATVFTHERSSLVQGINSLIGFITININLTFSNEKQLWHSDGSAHNGRSIAQCTSGDYVLGSGIADRATSLRNPAWLKVDPSGTPTSKFLRYNILDDVYFGHLTSDMARREFVLVNDHRTDLREIRTDINGRACGLKEYEPRYDRYAPKKTLYRYDYKKQQGQKEYRPKEKHHRPDYRKCVNNAASYRTTGIAQWSMDNENIALYPSVLSSQQNYLTLENNTGSELRVEVRNIAGQLIFSAEQIGAGKNELNLSTNGNLATGIYLVNVFNSQGQLSNSTKIIVNQ